MNGWGLLANVVGSGAAGGLNAHADVLKAQRVSAEKERLMNLEDQRQLNYLKIQNQNAMNRQQLADTKAMERLKLQKAHDLAMAKQGDAKAMERLKLQQSGDLANRRFTADKNQALQEQAQQYGLLGKQMDGAAAWLGQNRYRTEKPSGGLTDYQIYTAKVKNRDAAVASVFGEYSKPEGEWTAEERKAVEQKEKALNDMIPGMTAAPPVDVDALIQEALSDGQGAPQKATPDHTTMAPSHGRGEAQAAIIPGANKDAPPQQQKPQSGLLGKLDSIGAPSTDLGSVIAGGGKLTVDAVKKSPELMRMVNQWAVGMGKTAWDINKKIAAFIEYMYSDKDQIKPYGK